MEKHLLAEYLFFGVTSKKVNLRFKAIALHVSMAGFNRRHIYKWCGKKTSR